jgi:APA family basic amino acid/polyamine antiporter
MSNSQGSRERRRIGLVLGTFVTLGAIADAGIFVVLGPTVAAAGSGLLLSMAIAALVALSVAISGAQLGAAIPISGGGFIWARTFGLKYTSSVAGLSFVGKEIIVQSVNALTLALFAQILLPFLPQHTTAALTILAMTALNYFGAKPTTKMLAVFTSIVLVVLAAHVFLAFPETDRANLRPILGTGPMGILDGAGVVFFAFAGFERVAVIASTVKRPEKTIPRAIFLAFPVATTLFFLIAIATLGVLGPEAMAGDPKAVYFAFQQAVSGQWAWVIAAGVVIGTLSTLSASILGVSQVAQEMGAKEELPHWFAILKGKGRTPRYAVLSIGITIALITWFFNLRPLVDLANMFALIWYAAVSYAGVELGDRARFAPRWISWFGVVGCLVLIATLAWWAILLAVAVLGLALVIRHFARDPRSDIETSARNQLRGTIKLVRLESDVATVVLEVNGQEMVSVIPRGDAVRMGLEREQKVLAVIRETDVVFERVEEEEIAVVIRGSELRVEKYPGGG